MACNGKWKRFAGFAPSACMLSPLLECPKIALTGILFLSFFLSLIEVAIIRIASVNGFLLSVVF